MDNESSASSMVLKQLNHNSSQLTHDVKSSPRSRPSKKVIHVRSSRKKAFLQIEEKQIHTNPIQQVTQNKQNLSHNVVFSKQPSHAYLHSLSDEKQNPVKIENFTVNDKHQKSLFQKKKSVILLENVCRNQAYTKRLMTYLPPGNYCSSNILRQKSFLSTDVKLMIKGQEMIKAKKIGGCLINEYEIVSQNQRQNTLGYVKSSLSGSVFNIYENNVLNQKKLVGTIWYEDSFNFKSGPRSVEMYILDPEQSVQDIIVPGQESNLKDLYEKMTEKKITKLKSKAGEWRQSGYCVDFGVKHILPSIKNVILEDQNGNSLIGLYKIKPDEFEMVIRQGISTFIAYCFALSSLTFKLVCQ